MIVLKIDYSENNGIILTLNKGEITVKVHTCEKELLEKYNVTSEQVSFSILKNIISEEKLNLIKTFNYNSDVFEWKNADKSLSFKQENNLTVVTDITGGWWT